MIIVCKYLLFKGYNAVTLYPFIILKHKELNNDGVLIHHERIHLKQQIELLVLPFYLIYIIEFIVKLFIYKSHYAAYRNISFEREAYTNEHKNDYLKTRPFWAFSKYF